MFVTLPKSTMYDTDLEHYAKVLKIKKFRYVKMRDELQRSLPFLYECGIINLNTHDQAGSHWTCYFKNQDQRFYFDSYGQAPPDELIKYLKTPKELKENAAVIRRSAVVVQHLDSNECGSLCLYVLKKLSTGILFSEILNDLTKRFNQVPTPPLIIKV